MKDNNHDERAQRIKKLKNQNTKNENFRGGKKLNTGHQQHEGRPKSTGCIFQNAMNKEIKTKGCQQNKQQKRNACRANDIYSMMVALKVIPDGYLVKGCEIENSKAPIWNQYGIGEMLHSETR